MYRVPHKSIHIKKIFKNNNKLLIRMQFVLKAFQSGDFFAAKVKYMFKFLLFFFWLKKTNSCNFLKNLFCWEYSNYYPNFTLQTTLRFDNLLRLHEFLKCKRILWDSLNIFFIFWYEKKFIFWQVLWCKAHSSTEILQFFMIFFIYELTLDLFHLAFLYYH